MELKPWTFYLKYYRNAALPLSLIVVGFFVQALLQLCLIGLIQHTFHLVVRLVEPARLLSACLGLISLQLAISGILLLTRHHILRLTKERVKIFRESLTEKIMSLPFSFFIGNDVGELHSMVVQGSERVDIMSNAILALVSPACISATLLVGVLLYINYRLFFIIALCLPVLWFLSRIILKKMRAQAALFQATFDIFSGGMSFLVRSIDLIRIQSAEDTERIRQTRNFDRLREISRRGAWLNAAYETSQGLLAFLCTMLLLVYGGLDVSKGRMEAGALLSFVAAFAILRVHLMTISSGLPAIIDGHNSLTLLTAFLNTDEKPAYRGNAAIEFDGRVSLSAVDVRYGDQLVLKNVDLKIEPGQTVALTGPNGGGKTTLVNLILGLQRPTDGNMFAGEARYDDIDVASLRRGIGVVRQVPQTFAGTIRENISYGKSNATTDDILNAGELAMLGDVLKQLPDGYDTRIGDGGLRLSGGQAQRIALARALLSRPRLLILDEPTNHLDAASIRALLSNLKNLQPRPACLLISHDPMVLEKADVVYSLNQGVCKPISNHEI